MVTLKSAALSLLALSTALLGGCGAPDPGTADPASASTAAEAIAEGSLEAHGVVALLNDAKTTLYVLDELVPLNKTAATNLIAHRNGPDGVFGTADDNLFDDLAEVDAVPYVGPAALDALLAYALSKGYVPGPNDALGTYDNVAFTFAEAAATLALVNEASEATLDDDVGLDRRAVDSILAARPVKNLSHLASLYYVGQTAMLKLREYPKSVAPPPPPPPPPPSTGTVKNGNPCDAHAECQSGLCAGLLAPWMSHGYCMPANTAGTFTSSGPVAITDDGVSVTSSIPVSGLATVPFDVVVDLEIDHPRPQDLLVVLHQPGGASAVLWNHEAAPKSHFVWPSGLEGDNMVNGEWVLEVTDTVSGQSGTIKSWKMWLSSNWD